MADNDFFEKDNKMDNQQAENTQEIIKVGEKEYSQDELSRLVGLGEIGAESEEKYGVTIDKIWPNHQRTINEKIALEEKVKSFEEAKSKTPPTQEQVSEQEIATQAREQLGKLGYVGKDEVQRIVNDTLQGYRLLDDTQKIINEMVEDGYPKTTTEELLQFMSDPSNPKNPQKAYKLMFETEIDQIKEKKLASLKPAGYITESHSTAGSKAPAPQKIDSKNLHEALMAALPD